MSVIPCASVNLKTMADGTLRISFDIEPMHAQDAFKLFAAPGTPAAIAALAVGYAQKVDTLQEPVQKTLESIQVKGGPLSIEAASMCRNPEYWKYAGLSNESEAAKAMREYLDIETRAEIDHNEGAKERFIKDFRAPFMKYLIARGIVA
mgnify:FL=1|tara:strand:- start:788 stop:1234 length:447 start_codon:yes stop_codon:yes gene_type:complete